MTSRSAPTGVCRALALALSVASLLLSRTTRAGPPFLTDDPDPVETGHWEVYGAFQWAGNGQAASGTCPHVEVNYGALPGLQLHVIVPAGLTLARGESARWGLGDLEVGAKVRFFSEGPSSPEIGIFPLVFLPTGSKERGLGSGAVEALLPIWIQKRFCPWTTYGGGGIHIAADGNSTVAGWLVQRQLATWLTLGAEVFVTVPWSGGAVQKQVNMGLVLDLNERHHLLLSAGPSFGTDDRARAHLAYQLTI